VTSQTPRPARGQTPIALTIAGSDSGGGAGIQADLKTFSALGVYGASVITALTAQNTQAVTAVTEATPDMVRAQIAAVFEDLAIGAVKIGMLASPGIIRAVADELAGRPVPVVLDPVMVAKSGDRLLAEEAVAALTTELVPLATILTPNLPEAAALLERADVPEGARDAAAALLALGPEAVLLKGGHGAAAECVDLFQEAAAADPVILRAPRLATRNTHGTGCTLSAAIAAHLARGAALAEAVAAAHAYLQGAIAAADTLRIGQGRGPVHHFHAIWERA